MGWSRALAALTVGFLMAGCAGIAPIRGTPRAHQPARQADAASSRVEHVVIIVQENRSFDNFFATFPGADGTSVGQLHTGVTIPLRKGDLVMPYDLAHSFHGYEVAYNGGKMNGFDLEAGGGGTGPAGTYPYLYVDPKQIAPYWTLAKRYVLADHFFSTQGSDSFTAHQDVIAGGTQIDPSQSLIDLPSPGGRPWGCDAPKGTVTSLITLDNRYLFDRGPFPCLAYPTLAALLNRKHVSWKYYTPSFSQPGGQIWNAFDAIKAIRYSQQWKTNVSRPDTNVFVDIGRGRLPAVSWVIPEPHYSDHPHAPVDDGPSWVASIVNAIGSSSYWNSTVIVIVWDEWGGLYDHVPPPQMGFGGLGMRIPAIVVSPYARRGYVSHTQYEFGSILKFVENVWGLGRLGTTDVRANSIGDTLDFKQPPQKFVPVAALHSKEFFLRGAR